MSGLGVGLLLWAIALTVGRIVYELTRQAPAEGAPEKGEME